MLPINRITAHCSWRWNGKWSVASSLFYSRSFATLPPHTVMNMPSLSPTMTAGNLVGWKVKVGDQVKPSTLLAEIETDKATVDFESQDDGYVAKLLVQAGTQNIPCGKPIAVFCENKDDIKSFADYTVTESEPATKSTGAPPPPPPPAAASPTPQPSKSSPPPSPPSPSPNLASSTTPNTQQTLTGTTSPSPSNTQHVPNNMNAGKKPSPLDTILREERTAYHAKYGTTLLFR